MAAYQGQKVDWLDTMCRGGEGWLGRVWMGYSGRGSLYQLGYRPDRRRGDGGMGGRIGRG